MAGWCWESKDRDHLQFMVITYGWFISATTLSYFWIFLVTIFFTKVDKESDNFLLYVKSKKYLVTFWVNSNIWSHWFLLELSSNVTWRLMKELCPHIIFVNCLTGQTWGVFCEAIKINIIGITGFAHRCTYLKIIIRVGVTILSYQNGHTHLHLNVP